MNSLSIPAPEGAISSSIAAKVSGKTYLFGDNLANLVSVRFDFSSEGSRIYYETAEGVMDAPIGYKKWEKSKIQAKEVPQHLVPYQNTAFAGAWDGETYQLRAVYFNTPSHDDWRISFKGSSIVIDIERSIDFVPLKLRIVGVER